MVGDVGADQHDASLHDMRVATATLLTELSNAAKVVGSQPDIILRLPELINQVESETARLTTIVDEYEHSCADQQSRLATLRKQSDAVDADALNKREELERLRQESTTERDTVKALEKDRQRLDAMIAEETLALQRLETKREQMEELKKSLSASRKELQELESRLHSEKLDTESKKIEWKVGEDTLRACTDTLRSFVSSLPPLDEDADISDFSSKFRRLAKLLIEDRNNHANTVAEIEAKRCDETHRWSAERHDLQQSLAQLQAEVETHGNVKQELRTTKEASRVDTNKIVSLEQAVKDLRQQLAICKSDSQTSASKFAEEKAKLMEQTKTQREKYSRYETENQRLTDLNAALTRRIEELRTTSHTTFEQFRRSNQDVQELRKTKADLQNSISIMEKVLTQQEDVRATLENHERKYRLERNKYLDTLKQLDQCQTRLSKEADKYRLLFDESAKATDTLTETRLLLDKERTASEKLTTQHREHEKAIQEHRIKGQEYAARIEKLESDIATSVQENDRYKTEIQAVQLQIEKQTTDSEKLIARCHEYESAIQGHGDKCQNYLSRIEQLENDVAASDQERDRCKSEMQTTQSQFEIKSSELVELQQSLIEAEGRAQDLGKEKASIENKLKVSENAKSSIENKLKVSENALFINNKIIHDLKKSIQELEKLHQTVLSSHKNELNKMDYRIEKSASNFEIVQARLRATQEEVSCKNTELEAKDDEIRRCLAVASRHDTELADKNHKINRQRTELEKRHEELKWKDDELMQKNTELKEKDDKLRELDNDLKQMANILNQKELVISTVNGDLIRERQDNRTEVLTQELRRMKTERKRYADNQERLQQEVERMRKKHRKYVDDRHESQEEILSLRDQAKSDQQRLDELDQEVKEANALLEAYKASDMSRDLEKQVERLTKEAA